MAIPLNNQGQFALGYAGKLVMMKNSAVMKTIRIATFLSLVLVHTFKDLFLNLKGFLS